MGFVNWNGDEWKEKIKEAALKGIDQVLGQCVTEAKSDHPWSNITGTAEGSIQMREAEEVSEGSFHGEWGSYDVNYFIFLELGTEKMSPYPILRPTSDRLFPTLKDRIKENLGSS